jgi:hypothetical protein
MSAYDIVLALHIFALVFGASVAAVAHSTMFRLRSAPDVATARDHLRVLDKTGPLFPIAGVLLFLFGAALIHLSDSSNKWHWTDGWIVTAIVSLVVVEGVGGVVIGRGVKQIDRRFEQLAAGPLDASARALLADRPVWLASHFTTAVIMSVVLLMTTKPSGVVSVLVVLIGASIGLLSAVPYAKPAAVSEAAGV